MSIDIKWGLQAVAGVAILVSAACSSGSPVTDGDCMTALMYHDVVAEGMEDTSGFPGRDAARYKVTPARFESHLDAIAGSYGAHRPAITFDDGGASALGAADVLERYGLRGHFFVTVNYIGKPGFLHPAGIRELHDRGHEVGSHSCSHPLRMGHLPPARLRDE